MGFIGFLWNDCQWSMMPKINKEECAFFSSTCALEDEELSTSDFSSWMPIFQKLPSEKQEERKKVEKDIFLLPCFPNNEKDCHFSCLASQAIENI